MSNVSDDIHGEVTGDAQQDGIRSTDERDRQDLGEGDGDDESLDGLLGSEPRTLGGDDGRPDAVAADAPGGRELGLPSRGDVRSPRRVHQDEQRTESERRLLQVSESYSGEALHPRLARDWESVVPGSADRLLSLTELSVRGRHDVARRLSRAEAFSVVVGSLSLPVLGIGGLTASVTLVLKGYDGYAVLTALPAILWGVGAGFGAWRRGGQSEDAPDEDEE